MGLSTSRYLRRSPWLIMKNKLLKCSDSDGSCDGAVATKEETDNKIGILLYKGLLAGN